MALVYRFIMTVLTLNIKHVRKKSVGLFDVSHMGQIIIEGDQAFQFLQKLTTNDVSKLDIGGVQYSCMTNEKGMVLDDLLIYMLSEKKFMLVVNASNTSKIIKWIRLIIYFLWKLKILPKIEAS